METEYLTISELVKREIKLSFYGTSSYAPLLAEGFLLLDCSYSWRTSSLANTINNSLKHNKPSIICFPNLKCFEFLNNLKDEKSKLNIIVALEDKVLSIPFNYIFSPIEDQIFKYIFLIPEDYLLRRFFIREITRKKYAFKDQNTLVKQIIRCVGLPPLKNYILEETVALIEESENVILFDRTKINIVFDLKLKSENIIKYDYFDYNKNIINVNNELARLHQRGVYDVTLLIEGHPDIYDLVECLPHGNREFIIQPTNPLLCYAVDKLEKDFNLSIFKPAFMLTSGFNMRQGITTTFLKSEIESYLGTSLSILVMEMFLGDLPLILSIIQRNINRKCVFILTNMFSMEENVFFLSNARLEEIYWINDIKGKFTSLVILDSKVFNKESLFLIKEKLKDKAKI